MDATLQDLIDRGEALNDMRKEGQDSEEYQEYLRLKEKFGGK